MPGPGFFTMARDMGFNVSDQFMFFVSQLNEVHNYWAPAKRP